MRILIITEFFDPEPTIKGLAFAQALADRGHSVQVLTGFPNYPLGTIYAGYRVRLWQRERHGAVEVVRVPLYPSHDRHPLRRAATYASFALTASIIGPFVTVRPDVLYVYHPPATIGLAAIVHSRFRRVPFVLDIQDIWPDTLRASGMIRNRFLLKVVAWWCRRMYAAASRVVVLSPGFRQLLVERGVTPDKIDVIYNWASEDDPVQGSNGFEALALREGFIVLFAGTMGLAQGLDVVLDAAKLLLSREPTVRFVFIGGGVDNLRLRRRAAELNLDNVEFHDARPMNSMGPILQAAAALLIHLTDDPLFRVTIPSKTQAYLAAGRPILVGVEGDARDLVERAGAGIGFLPGDCRALASAVMALVRMAPADRHAMGERARSFYWSNLAKGRGVEAFELSFIAASSSPSRDVAAPLSS